MSSQRFLSLAVACALALGVAGCGGGSSSGGGSQTPAVASLAISPASLTFASTALGTSASTQTVTVSNPGTVAISLTSVAVTGTNASDFAVTANTCGATLAGFGSCAIAVNFTPAAVGTRTASVAVANSGATSPTTFSLSGIATPATLTALPGTLTFASTNVGSSAAAQTITVTNPGAVAVAFSGITLTGTNAGDFTIATNTCGASVNGNATCSLGIVFAPTAAGTRTASVSIANAGAVSPLSVTLTGTGVALPIMVSLSKTSVSLAAGGSQAFTATVTNDATNSGVSWSIGSGAGTLTASTSTSVTYYAPPSITTGSTVTLVATSIKDTTKSAQATITLTANTAPASQWVYYNTSGNLAYKTIANADNPGTLGYDQIMDFSTAGYMAGGTAIPTAAVAVTLSPSGGDDTSAIQAAINTVAAMTLNTTTGLRGAVLLNPGNYTVSSTININASGVVVRGSGDGTTASSNTILTMTAASTPYPLFQIGSSSASPSYTSGTTTTVTDSYVPAGSLKLDVSNASVYSVGQSVMINRPATTAWISYMDMQPSEIASGSNCSSGTCNWINTGSNTFKTDRIITAISGNTITLDSPMSDSLDSTYIGVGGATVEAFTFPGRVSQVGLENLRVVTPVPATNLVPPTASYQVAVTYAVLNGWIRNITSQDALQAIDIETWGKQITVSNVAITHTVTQTDSAKFEEYYVNGATQVLFDTVSDTTDNMYFFSTSSETQGPIVLRNGTFLGNTNVEPHQRWATGLLIENTTVGAVTSSDTAGQTNLWDRGDYGSGQGWAIGWGVIWNNTAGGFTIQQPPGAQNWCIGCVGTQIVTAAPGGSTKLTQGAIDSAGVYVFPTSLYQAQLTQRLGVGVIAQ